MAHSTVKGSQNYIWSTLDVLGHGATASVYRCREKKTGEVFAVKTFNPQSQLRPRNVQVREFDVLRKLKHPNIVTLLAIEEEQMSRTPVIIMELCTGGSLYSMLEQPVNYFGLTEEEFLLVLRHVVDGMYHLHQQSVVHRDIKPGNIMRYIGEDGRSLYKLTDFGAARELMEEEQFMSLYGTEEYLHPDLYERAVLRRPHSKSFDATVDLWSLGVTIYHVATGQLPFRPFGGRKNRETMYKITTEKESGVISGIQETDRGQILWSRELPSTCKLSQGLKTLIIPMLAGLMEVEPEKMWTFRRFFKQVNDVYNKAVVHVFNVCAASRHRIYINKDQSLARLQELIAAQTDLRAGSQLLLFEENYFTLHVAPTQAVSTYPETASDSPIFLFSREMAEQIQFHNANYPKISTSICVDTDANLAKVCTGITYHILRETEEAVAVQQLLHQAVKLYNFMICKDIERLKDFIPQFALVSKETFKKVTYYVDSHALHIHALKLCTRNANLEMEKEVKDKSLDLNDLVAPWKSQCLELTQSYDKIQRHIEEYYSKFVDRKDLLSRWNFHIGCLKNDRCVAKVEVLLGKIRKIWEEFIKDKKHKNLSYNDVQIHTFEKNKLNENCTRCMSILQEHCRANLSQVHRSMTEWFRHASMTWSQVEEVEECINEQTKKQNLLSTAIDKAQQQYISQYMEYLRQTEPVTIATGSNGISGSSHHSVIKDLFKDIKSLQTEGSHIRQAIEENSRLLKRLEEMNVNEELLTHTGSPQISQ